jgi:thiamine-phosphate pyrophosphorylase
MLILVTNRKLCKDDFLQQIQQLVQGKPHAIMLREKDLVLADFEVLARKVKEICEEAQVPLIMNQNIDAAAKLNMLNIHLSISDLRKHQNDLFPFTNIGASVHSVSEAVEAEKLGATYVVAGHIFSTDCKKGVPPRGLPFLKEVCDSVEIPVFAIGGITKDRVRNVLGTGAKGMCIMSEAMICQNPSELVNQFRMEWM